LSTAAETICCTKEGTSDRLAQRSVDMKRRRME
jgi:hypothetical protein